MLPKNLRLKKAGDFRKIYKDGLAVVNPYIVVRFIPSNQARVSRIGFAVSKKIGKAVERNRVKRILREACRRQCDLLPEGSDMVFIARPKIKGIGYALVEKQIALILRQSLNKAKP